MKHALKIAADRNASQPIPFRPHQIRERQAEALSLRAVPGRDVTSRDTSARDAALTATGFSPLVQEFLDECGYSDK